MREGITGIAAEIRLSKQIRGLVEYIKRIIISIIIILLIVFGYQYLNPVPRDLSDPNQQNLIQSNLTADQSLTLALTEYPHQKYYAYHVHQVFVNQTINHTQYNEYMWSVRIYSTRLNQNKVEYYDFLLDLNTGEVIKMQKVGEIKQP